MVSDVQSDKVLHPNMLLLNCSIPCDQEKSGKAKFQNIPAELPILTQLFLLHLLFKVLPVPEPRSSVPVTKPHPVPRPRSFVAVVKLCSIPTCRVRNNPVPASRIPCKRDVSVFSPIISDPSD